jgi:hypothetical protein
MNKMLKMTLSIPKLEGTKSNLNVTCIAHHTRVRNAYTVHREPKPNIKGGYHHKNL